jgi:Flp pilus assembly protein TadG
MLQLRARRGAIAILTVLLFLALLGIGAIVVDFSRMQVMRNQLQTAADAAALAGAIQLVRTPKTDYLAQAQTIGQANPLFDQQVTVPDTAVELGTWDPASRVFTGNGNNPTTANAVRVTLRHDASYLMANHLGWPVKPVAAQAVAWAGPTVGKTDCMKPWALWYGLLMGRINTYLGLENNDANLSRPMTPEDLDALRAMSEDARTFNIFLGTLNDKSQVLNSGNFYAVDLPPVQYADGTPGTPLTGGSAYTDAIAGVDNNGNPVCYSVGVGDILQTEPGAMIGPTKQGMTPNVCAILAGDDCLGADGNPPVIKSAFWSQATNKGNGKFTVEVEVIGSFVLKKFYQQSNELHIVGTFQPIADNGPVGGATTTLVKVILVK